MKIRLLHKNLDTAYVDLTAMLRNLRQQKFVGMVRVEIGEYKAEVIFDEMHRVKMREFEGQTDRMVESADALNRLLQLSKVPGGVVNVFEAVGVEKKKIAAEEKGDILDLAQGIKAETPKKQFEQQPAPKIPKPSEKVFAASLEKVFSNGNGNGNGKSKNGFDKETTAAIFTNGHDITGIAESDENVAGDIFPVYSHPVEIVEERVETVQKAPMLSAQEWEELIATTAALLGTIDSILKAARLGFPDAFTKSRVEVSNEYPFLHPLKGILHYDEGRVTLNEEVPPSLLVAGISECLRRILNKLISNPKFFAVYKRITQQVLILVRQRQAQFDRFGYTKQLERIIKF